MGIFGMFKRFMRKIIIIISCLLVGVSAKPQQFEWLAGFDGFLDNREYYNEYQVPQTIFGSHLRAEIGGNLNGIHRLRAGFNTMYEFGSNSEDIESTPVMYYQLDIRPYSFNMGVFPRRNLLDFPLALLNDTLNYYRPNIEGMYLRREGGWGYQDVFIDWTSRKTNYDYERFMFGFSGRVNISSLFISHHFLMGHFAARGYPVPGFHIRDNGGFELSLGTDLSERTVLDTLVFSLGGLVSLDRTRGVDNGWQTPAGMIARADLMYRIAGIRTTIHAGKGHTFLYGDSFYRADFYTRIDMFLQLFNSDNVHARVNFSLHMVKGTLDTSQQVLVSFNLDGKRPQ
jgi:hypothetical protein